MRQINFNRPITELGLVSYLLNVREEEKMLLNINKSIIADLDEPFERKKGKKKCKCKCLKDTIPCNDCADALVIEESKKLVIEFALENLPPKQYYLLTHLFGVDGYDEQLLCDIALDLRIKMASARNLKMRAFNTIRRSPYARTLMSYMC